ncbi:alpha-hydroxy acid oxidase [Novosphingobium sp. P6W]|uniref:alpha-hydroxy acid oxidase n=1 Tax=Novosphingobium sp. P6W TaxID=1609758 RepID=UPI0005C2FA24|nr:alpha-hydroxy acid oxidase [Novosphingobium sp. P6W]AXB78041.1 alpha-hydroxy-acid oxidizing protein [Novosphingobium sp. P6W]KIS31269.1 2-hydroxy-acid oxidase [Novosphingobium sp. P6W]
MSEGPPPPLTAIPASLRSLADYEARAPQHMMAQVWQHIREGAGREVTLRENRAAFDRIGLLPRAMAELDGDTRIDLFGRSHASPILLAPLAYMRLAHPEGELAAVRAAAALDAGMVVSTLASASLEDIASAGRALSQELGRQPAPLWFQLYLQPEREHSLQLLRRAEDAGYEAIVLTIDAGLKPAGITLPPGVDAVNLAGMPRPRQTSVPGGRILLGTPLTDAAPKWADLAWLRAATTLPILVKGLVLGGDARRTVDEGADGLIVSNHGGRVLDGLPSALDLLPAVVETTRGQVPLLLDGGVRQGTDVVKALALGAKAVLVGRPQMHALAVAGMPGLAHVIHLLRTELEAAMAQLGCPRVDLLGRERLVTLGA